jgi:2-methylcitrate dehydratase
MKGCTVDDVICDLARFCDEVRFDQLPAPIVHAATERLVDTIGCAVGGAGCAAADMGRRLAPHLDPAHRQRAARVLGASQRSTTLEAAGFVNSVMIRYLDFNDTYPGGHPSDALGPIIAVADTVGSSGEELIRALVVGYDIFVKFAMAAKLRERGWDQGFGVGLATTAGASILLGLDRERTAHALSISAVANVPMRATRAGQLSLWKGVATSYAASNALLGTLLAADGMTGPEAPITGRHGLKELITGEFTLPPFDTDPTSFVTQQARIKYWPVEYHLQAAVWAGIEFGAAFGVDELESVDIATYWSAWHETGSEAAKWDPQTRETADHSLPYVFVKAMQAGALEVSAFEPEEFLDPGVRTLMTKVRVHVDDELEARFPDEIVMRATARTTSGAEHSTEIVNPRGHEANPVTTDEVTEKFRRLVEPVYGAERTAMIGAAWWQAASAASVRDLVDLLATP